VNPVDHLVRAWTGLSQIAAGRPEASRQFTPDLAGFGVACGWFLLALLLAAAAQSVAVGLPRPDQVLVGLGIRAITLIVPFWATRATLGFLKLETPAIALLVPMIYVLGLMQVIAIPLILLGPNGQLLAIFAAALLMGRIGKVLAGMGTGTAFAFALQCLLVLVLVPVALYMVFVQIPSPA
jgi:hypothetical protein